MCKHLFLKRYVCQHCVAFKTGKRSPFFISVLIQSIDVSCIFSHLLADVPPGPKLANVPPFKSGGPFRYRISKLGRGSGQCLNFEFLLASLFLSSTQNPNLAAATPNCNFTSYQYFPDTQTQNWAADAASFLTLNLASYQYVYLVFENVRRYV